MKLKLITPPASLPVSLTEAKSFYRVLSNDEDVEITSSITAATEKAEQITNRQLVSATYEGYLDAFCSALKLPKSPLKSVVSVKYIDVNGITKTFSDYYVDDVAVPAVLYFRSFPTDVRVDDVNNVIITFTCGYDTVPEAIKSWIKIYGLTLFEHRENLVDGVSVDDSKSSYFNHLLDSYRVIPV